jgi:hypothetical protein
MTTKSPMNVTTRIAIFLFLPLSFTSCITLEELTCATFGTHCPPTEGPAPIYSNITPIHRRADSTVSEEKPSEQKVRGILGNLEVGPTINFKSSEERPNFEHKPGVGFQVLAGSYWPIGNNIYLHPSIGFKQSRAYEEVITEGENPYDLYTRRDEYVFNYLTFPLMAEYRLRNNRTAFFAGPEFTYLLGAKWKIEDYTSQKLNPIAVKPGFGMYVGLRQHFGRYSAHFRYDRRISNLNRTALPGDTYSPWRMSSLYVGMSYDLCNCR